MTTTQEKGAAMQFEIKSRWSGAVIFTAEISADESTPLSIKLGLAVRVAYERKADLSRANLSGANLSGANLSRANLSGANLSRADLSRADLSRANLSGANLSGANLSRANLSGANLSWADLSRANLSGANLSWAGLSRANLSRADLSEADLSWANLSWANLSGANLSEADLSRANLSRADLRSFKADFWMVLTQNRAEVPALIAALCDGRVDGSTYEGDCCCLVGTIANARNVRIGDIEHDPSHPAESWFAMIHRGDKPGDETGGGFANRTAVRWALEFCALNGIESQPEWVAASVEPEKAVAP